MDDLDWLTQRFEQHRSHLRAVAYRMLGSLSEAEDAVQETWLRLNRADTSDVENLGGWLTTVTARVCLNVLRSRRTHPEEPLDARLPDPIVTREDTVDPESAALLADSVGLAMLVVLETLNPPERLAFVLHDTFAVPFDEIAAIIGCSPTAARQLASRARRRVRGAAPLPDPDLARQREVVDAFLAAARHGDFDALVTVLHPDVVLRYDGGTVRAGGSGLISGARAVAKAARTFSRRARYVRPALVNGAAGLVVAVSGRPIAIMGFTVSEGQIVEIDILGDRERLGRLDLTILDT